VRCPANAVVYGLISLAQNGGKGSGVLTELGFEGEGRAKTMAMLTGGGAGTVIAGGVRRPFSGRLDSADQLLASLRGRQMGYQDRSGTGGKKTGQQRAHRRRRGSAPSGGEAGRGARVAGWRR